MARPHKTQRKLKKLLLIQEIATTMLLLIFISTILLFVHAFGLKIREIKTKEEKRIKRMNWMFRLAVESDNVYISELCMDRENFRVLCDMVSEIGCLKPNINTSIEEVVAMFLYTLAHHKKSRTIGYLFSCSRETVTRQCHQVLLAILKLHHILLKKPEPITQDFQEERWKCFEGCLEALDGTLIKVTPTSDEKYRYRTRKGCISTNIFGVCCLNMQFIYVLPGWEGSTHDGRMLRDAISGPQGLRVPCGGYYLVDIGYCNANGFLALYRGQQYHLKEFNGHRLETAKEFFNKKHSKARNVIDREMFWIVKRKMEDPCIPFILLHSNPSVNYHGTLLEN